MTNIILDTDIGTDGDDALALVYGIAQQIDIKLISTVHGNTPLRAKIANHITDLAKTAIPIVAGIEKPIKQEELGIFVILFRKTKRLFVKFCPSIKRRAILICLCVVLTRHRSVKSSTRLRNSSWLKKLLNMLLNSAERVFWNCFLN